MRAQPLEPDSLPLDQGVRGFLPARGRLLQEVANILEEAVPDRLMAYNEVEIRWETEDFGMQRVVPDALVGPRSLMRSAEPYAVPHDVELVVEVESPSSKAGDRRIKPLL